MWNVELDKLEVFRSVEHNKKAERNLRVDVQLCFSKKKENLICEPQRRQTHSFS
jgi:hypothetical protein